MRAADGPVASSCCCRRFIRRGTLRVTTARGTVFTFGDGTGPPVAIRFTTTAAQRGVLLDPELEARRSLHGRHASWSSKARSPTCSPSCSARAPTACRPTGRGCNGSLRYLNRRLRAVQPAAPARGATSRITTISTAGSIRCSSTPTGNTAAPISSSPDQSLDDAQLAKKRHLAAKLLLEPRRSACSTSAAAGAGSRSISPNSAARASPASRCRRSSSRVADERAAEKGLDRNGRVPPAGLPRHRANASTASSRSACSSMSASVYYDTFFRKCAELLADDGVMLLHSIGRSEGPSVTNPWIAKYIFPGGYIPALSEVLPAIERAGLLVTDIEILRLHYAETLQALARALPRAPRGSRAPLRRALRADVGILPGGVRDGVPRAGHDGVPDPAHQAPGRGADDARLHRARGSAAARARGRPAGRRCGSPANRRHSRATCRSCRVASSGTFASVHIGAANVRRASRCDIVRQAIRACRIVERSRSRVSASVQPTLVSHELPQHTTLTMAPLESTAPQAGRRTRRRSTAPRRTTSRRSRRCSARSSSTTRRSTAFRTSSKPRAFLRADPPADLRARARA